MKNDPVHGFSTSNGKFVQIGLDKDGNPLYQSIEAATGTLTIFSENHQRARGSVGKSTGKPNARNEFVEIRPSSGSVN